MATLLPILKPLRAMDEDFRQKALALRVQESVEAFSMTAARLPCPASSDNGVESIDPQTGLCSSDHGYFPWQTLGLVHKESGWQLHTQSLNTLGTPFAGALTRSWGIRNVNVEQLTRAVFNPPGNTTNPATVPSFQICGEDNLNTPNNASTCTANTYSGSAVLVVIPAQKINSAIALYNAQSPRIFLYDSAAPAGTSIMWMSFERLMWLWLQAGVLP